MEGTNVLFHIEVVASFEFPEQSEFTELWVKARHWTRCDQWPHFCFGAVCDYVG